jgi:23S rRNA (cytosine1962-C5)-methyltransferase
LPLARARASAKLRGVNTPATAARPPLVLYEDEHLLVVNKPPGWNTHAPAPYAGEGVYDWLRHREPRWADLAILHRLDKETSGLLVFGKTALANRALTAQFTRREVRKEYRLATRAPVRFRTLEVRTGLRRAGERYLATPAPADPEAAVTCFEVLDPAGELTWLRAVPWTGRTHQIRVHAAARGFPVLGDTLYGGAPAARLWLHAERLVFRHPATGHEVTFEAPADFVAEPSRLLRAAIIEPELTDAFRLWHGAGEPGAAAQAATLAPDWQVDRLGPYLLAQSAMPPGAPEWAHLERTLTREGARGAYHKALRQDVRGRTGATVSPHHVLGEAAPEAFTIRENGLRFEIRFGEGYSVGLFLDQRDNRRRLLVNHVAAGFPAFPAGPTGASVLNLFAYTCGFSVCAARAGARTTSVDLSRKYLDWGRRNFALNGLDAAGHEFLVGDALDWLRRLARRGRRFDAVLLDPPTFSTARRGRAFRAEHDYARLVGAAAPVVAPGGLLFAATNAAELGPEKFLRQIHDALAGAGRRVVSEHYAPQQPDFPISRARPAHLKSVWLRLA